MSSYNKNDTFGVKGRIGELIFANYILSINPNSEIIEDKELQKEGVDFIVDNIRVDVKLSDQLDGYFSLAYQNSNGLRNPFRPNTNVDRIVVVTFNWTDFQNNYAIGLPNDVEELTNKLLNFLKENELEQIMNRQSKKNEKELIKYLKELYIGHVVVSKLEEEYNNSKSFTYTNKLIDKYVKSIRSISAVRIINCARPLTNCPDGIQVVHPSPNYGIVKRVECYTRYGKMTAIQMDWTVVEGYYTSLYEQKNANKGNTNEVKILFGKYKGEKIKDLPNSYLTWLIEEAKNTKGQYDFFYEEFEKRGL